jgi:methyltransferase (TIGR00027 family)
MKTNGASRTAEYMAFFRALETIRPAESSLFRDPFARYFVGPSLHRAVRLAQIPILGGIVPWYADRRLPGARTSAIARTRLIDDALSAALGEGVGQVVILGAGFDCRAYRLPQLRNAIVFEVDHPSTLALKRTGLQQLLGAIPNHVRFVEIDFNRQTLAEGLEQAGYQNSRAAVFLWEGVTNYLAPAAVDAVLHYVAACHPRTQLIFTYIHSGVLDGSVNFTGAERLLKDVARIDEPWTFGLRPDELPEFLGQRGLCLDRDLSAQEYRRQYFGAASQQMKGYDFYHVALAHVPEEKLHA